MSTGHLASMETSATAISHTAKWHSKAAGGKESNDNIMSTAPSTSFKDVPDTQHTQPHTDTVIATQLGSNHAEMFPGDNKTLPSKQETDTHANELNKGYVIVQREVNPTNNDQQEVISDTSGALKVDDVDCNIKLPVQEDSYETIVDDSIKFAFNKPHETDQQAHPSQELDALPPTEENVTFTVKNEALLTDEFKKQLFDMKKIIGFNLTELVRQELTTVICKRFDISTDIEDDIPKYISKCIEICWYMGLQNPPVFMKFEEISDGITFDVNMYKPYTKTGKHIAYVVWPPLFLHKDGSMLSKGVSQWKK